MQLRIQEDTWLTLVRDLLARGDVETAAIILAEQVESDEGPVLVARQVEMVPDNGYVIRRIDQLRIDPVAINRLVRPARERGLSILTVHSHPMAADAWFSHADDMGDARLLPSFAVQVPDVPHGSLVIAKTGATVARARVGGDLVPVTIRVVGRGVTTATVLALTEEDKRFARQVLALGRDGQEVLQGLRVGIVGLGGTGSIVALQLAHLGIGELTLVDGDRVDESNVSRLPGVESSDVGSTMKTAVARRYIARTGLPIRLVTHDRFLSCREDLRALAACDAIMSCVDRHTPRALLNRFAYEALVPVIDMGTAFRVDVMGKVVGSAGRVVVVGPGRPCLACWGHIDPAALRREALTPDEMAAEEAEGYIAGANVQQPSVIPFNTMVAGAAVIELLRIFTGFAGMDDAPLRLAFRFEDGTVRRNVLAGELPCQVCGPSVGGKTSAWSAYG